MTWNTLRQRAQQLGFNLSYRTRAATDGGYLPEMATPPEAGGPWLCIGNYEHVAGLWLSPVTDEARGLSRERRNTSRQHTGQSPVADEAQHLSCERIAMLVENCDPFVETLGDYDAEFFAACAPGRAAADHPECGRMPS
jgi:hypothetical protein